MGEKQRGRLFAYGVAVLVTALSLLARWPLWPLLGNTVPHLAFLPAVVVAAYVGGFWPGLLATFLSAFAANYFLGHQFTGGDPVANNRVAVVLFVLTGAIISALSESLHRARLRIAANERRYAVILASIGDAVIATDKEGRVNFLNPAAEALTGWPLRDAAGRPLAEVFRVINEETRRPAEDPAAKVLREGSGVGRANRTALVARDGREIPVDDCVAPIVDDGGVHGVVRVFRDTTERRRAEEAEALRRAHARLEVAVRGSNICIWEFEMPDGVIDDSRATFINVWELLGYDPADAPAGYPDARELALHPDDRDRVRRAVLAFLAGKGREFEDEYRVLHKDGAVHWHLSRGVAERDPRGRPYRFIGIAIDITDLKRAEEALRKSEQRFRTFVDHATDAFFLFDDANVVLDVNRQACDSLGYTREELLGMTPLDFDARVSRARLDDINRELEDGRLMAFESLHRRKDGTVFPVEVRGRAFEEGGRWFAVALSRDVTERKRADEALRESEERWRSLTEALPHLVWSAMPDGSCDYFSAQWSEHTGVPESDLLGWRWMETLHPDDREPTRRFWTDSVAGRGPYDVEYRVRRRDGAYRWFKTRGVPVRDGAGNVRKWFGTCTDITDLRETEEALRASEERFRGTFENAAVGIAHCDLEGRYLRVNQRYGEIVGYSAAELLARRFQDVTHPDDLDSSMTRFTPLVQGDTSSYRQEKRLLRKDGSVAWINLYVSLQRDTAGEPAHTIGVIEDVSERRRLEEELRQAKEAAEAANRAKDEFLANVSHEIRTPMNAILGMTELALDTPLTEDQRQCLRTVKSAADSLLGIINDLLDFSKIEAGKLELDPADFSLRSAVGDTLRALATRAHKKRLELVSDVQPDVPDALVGDAGRLRQVLLNLVGNALKFTDEGEVIVRVEVAEAAADGRVGLRFAVRDTGIGVPPDKQESIFRAFEQEDTSTTRKYGGTGLGLTIAARLVALMGGQIGVDSAPGRGSTFAFTGRFGLQPFPAEPAAAQPPVLLRSLPVLVVDDNATNRHILQEWLRTWRMEPAMAGDGVAAMDALWEGVSRGRPYALVLLDVRMPDTDGLALATRIRKRAELSGTRIVLLTSEDRPGDRDRIRDLRIDARLLKPVQQEELLETMYRVMSRAAGDEARAARPAAAQDPAAPAPAATRLHILVAEDNEFSAGLMEQLLTRRGHRVQLTGDGREALALAEETAFDLLLLDIHMPGLDGFGVVQTIRERERASGRHLPVVALTARSRQEDRDRCLAAGMDDFLTKPIATTDLFAMIDRMASGGRAAAAAQADGGDLRTLLDAAAVIRACGDDAEALQRMCQDLQTYAPVQMADVGDALRARDAARLQRAAHKFCALLFAFSTVAGNVMSDVEDYAARGELEEAGPLVEQLETMTSKLLRLASDLSLGTLHRLAGAARD